MSESLEEWYDRVYSDGKRVFVRHDWATHSTKEEDIEHAKGIAMRKTEKCLELLKKKRPMSKWEVRHSVMPHPENPMFPRVGVFGVIDLFEAEVVEE